MVNNNNNKETQRLELSKYIVQSLAIKTGS